MSTILQKRRLMAGVFTPRRFAPIVMALWLLIGGTVAVVNAAARPIEVSLNSGDPWEFETDQDLITAGTPIFVATGGVGFTARVTIDVGDSGDDSWESTSYQFLTGAANGVTTTGPVTCINHADVATDGSFFDFALTAPAAAGVYGIRFIAYNTTDNCTSGEPRTVNVLTSVNVGGENPEADPGCGFSMGLIVDSSGSIDDGGQADEDAVKAAVIALLGQLEGTGVEVSLIDFDTNATIIFQPTVASAALTADTLANWNYNADDFTNWQDALQTQESDLNDYNSGPGGEPSSVPDFVLFFTDGAPTVRIGATGGVTDSDGLNLTLAVVEANLLKAAGARMLGIGVGGITDSIENVNRLKAVTGPVQSVGTPDPLTDDLIITNFDDLTLAFQNLALSLCGSSLTILKEVPDGQGGWESAPGWEFTADVSMTTGGANDYEWELPDPGATAGDPVTESTNVNGIVSYQWQPDNPPTGADVFVEETIQPGYTMVSVDCEETRLDGDDYDVVVNNLDLDAGTFDIELTNGSIGKCTVRNEPEPDEPELTLDKTSTTANYDSVGDVINYEYELTNTGNVPLTPPYAVTDDKATVTCPQVPNPLNPGASITCTASYIVTQADLDAGEVTNTAQGSAEFEGDPINSNEDEETVPGVQDPELTLDKTSTTANYDSVGDVINYEYELTNSGNVSLTPPYAVTDDKATVTCPQVPNPLVPGASITCTASYIVTQDDITNGSVTNTAQGSAEFEGDPVNSNEDEETVPADQNPELTLDKTSTTANYDSVGDVINYEYELTNSGNVPLTPPYAVTDDKATVTCPQVPNPLNPGASITCTASYIVTQDDITNGSVTNTAQGSAEFEGDPVNSNEDEETVPGVQDPALTLDKTSTTANYDSVGDVINYEYELTNSGNVPLTPPYAVTDDKATVTCPQVPNPLNPGASITCTASYIVTQDDITNGSVTNTAQGSAMYGQTPVNSNEDEETVPAVQSPSLSLDKSSTTLNYDSVGDVINYEYELTNSGNVPLTPPYAVTDDKATVTCPQVPNPLNPGASITCTASYIVTQDDITNGSVTNTAQGSAEFEGDPVNSNEDEETVPAVQGPSLSLDKSTTTLNYDSVGDVINYEYELTNSGNVPLTPPYAVTDDKATVTCPQVPNPLNPGASITCTASYIVTQADITNGSVTNTAQGSAEFEGDPVNSNEDEVTVPAVQGPALTLDKTSTTANYDSVGDVINYEYELTNSGNVPLTPPYAVTDDKATVTCPQVPNPLNPGASITCTASYIVTQADLDAGEVTNTAQGSAEFEGDPVESNEDEETVPAIQDPELTLDKTTTTANYDSVGDVINYEYELTNSGNVSLSPTYSVADDKATVTCPQVPDPLAPGASITCTASYIITPADMVNGSVTNVAQGRAFFNDSPVDSNLDEVTVPAVPTGGNCPVNAAGNQWTDILGIGMGNPKKHKNIAKVLIPNAGDVLSLYGQMAAKDPGNIKYVRFLYPNSTFEQEIVPVSPAPITYGVLWYGTELEPANHIRGRWFLQKFGVKNHVPRALVLYPTYYDEGNQYVNVFQTLDTSDTQVYWEESNGWTQTQQVVVEIPAPLAPSTFNIELALVDNDNDVRPIYVTVSAGGVTLMQQPVAPNRGDLLNLLQFTLENVPAGTDEILIEITSPDPFTNELGALGGDSGALIGVTANYLCVEGPR